MSDEKGQVLQIDVNATIKKVETTADKGGTVVVKLEIPKGKEAAEIMMHANSTCKMVFDFSEAQQEMDFEEDNGSSE